MKSKLVLLAALAILSFSPANASNVTNSLSDDATKVQSYCGVTGQQICEYMLDRGYVVTQINQITGSCNVIVRTSSGKSFTVFIINGFIEGYDEYDA